MKHFILKLISLIENNIIIDTFDLLNIIGFYILFFKENIVLADVIKLYDSLINSYNKRIKTVFNFNLYILSFNKFQELYYTVIDYQFKKSYNLLEEIYEIFKSNKILKQQYKNIKELYINKSIFDYINQILKDKQYDSILNLYSGIGCFVNNIFNTNIKYKNIDIYNNNANLNLFCYLNILLTYNIDIKDSLIESTIINDNNINKKYDLIICDIPDDIRNIIYANLNNKIKQLKIRGTKVEPLIVQFISTLLNINGEAIIITPDSLLFGESKQHIETRKYLLENLTINEIISLENKKSIIHLTNINKTKEIKINNLVLDITNIDSKKYSLYINNYINTKEISYNTEKLVNLIDITNNTNISNKILYCYKFNQLKIDYKNENDKNILYFISRDNNILLQDYLNYYLYNLINNNKKSLIKGKMEQLDIELLNDLNILIPSLNIQETYINYFNSQLDIINLINKQINNMEILKKNYIENIINNCSFIKLNDITNISHESNNKNNIMILKNSNLAGTVNLTINDNDKSGNIYYLDNTYNNKYLYHILKYYEPKLMELSNINNTILLSKKKLEDFDIPDLNDKQKEEINKIDFYNKEIDKLNLIINNLLNIDLFNRKLNNIDFMN